ncbi:hypothetical protein PINS_up003454 [Pythium insidiosum]|nr:hypothetical protein PINS_up003454 [Pythium insidiosum]
MSVVGIDVSLPSASDGCDLAGDHPRARCDTFDDLELSDVDDVEMADLDVDLFRPSAWTLDMDDSTSSHSIAHPNALLFDAPPPSRTTGSGSGLLCALAAQSAPFVVPTQRWDDGCGAATSHATAIAATLPPKYIDCASPAPRKRRALRRTFGNERVGRFSFASTTTTDPSTGLNDENASPQTEANGR